MKLGFLGADRDFPLLGLTELEGIAALLRERFDTIAFTGAPAGLAGHFATSFRQAGGKVALVGPLVSAGTAWVPDEVWPAKMATEAWQSLFDSTDAVLCCPGDLATHAALLQRLASPNAAATPIYLYNYDKFFAPLLLQIRLLAELGMTSAEVERALVVFETPAGLRPALRPG